MRRMKIAAALLVVFVVVASVVYHARSTPHLPPWLKLSRNTAPGDYVLHHNAPYYCGPAWPDGSGHALTWVYQPPRADQYLVQLPEAKVLRWARGFTYISWMRDGTLVGETFVITPGIPLLNKAPLLDHVKPFGPSADPFYCEVDWVNCRVLPLDKKKWPADRKAFLAGGYPLEYSITQPAPGPEPIRITLVSGVASAHGPNARNDDDGLSRDKSRRSDAAGGPWPPQPEGTPRYASHRSVARRQRMYSYAFLLAPCAAGISWRRRHDGYSDRLSMQLTPLADDDAIAQLRSAGTICPQAVLTPLTFKTGKALPPLLREMAAWDAKFISADLVTFRIDAPLMASSLWLANTRTGSVDMVLPLPGASMNPYSWNAFVALESTGP